MLARHVLINCAFTSVVLMLANMYIGICMSAPVLCSCSCARVQLTATCARLSQDETQIGLRERHRPPYFGTKYQERNELVFHRWLQSASESAGPANGRSASRIRGERTRLAGKQRAATRHATGRHSLWVKRSRMASERRSELWSRKRKIYQLHEKVFQVL